MSKTFIGNKFYRDISLAIILGLIGEHEEEFQRCVSDSDCHGKHSSNEQMIILLRFSFYGEKSLTTLYLLYVVIYRIS